MIDLHFSLWAILGCESLGSDELSFVLWNHLAFSFALSFYFEIINQVFNSQLEARYEFAMESRFVATEFLC